MAKKRGYRRSTIVRIVNLRKNDDSKPIHILALKALGETFALMARTATGQRAEMPAAKSEGDKKGPVKYEKLDENGKWQTK